MKYCYSLTLIILVLLESVMGAITPINIVSDLLQGVHQLKTSRKDRQIVSDSDRKLTDITPGYLNVKIFDSWSSCSVNADDTASTEGLWVVEVGIPIGICIAVPPFSIKIGYDMVPTTVAGINTNSYDFFLRSTFSPVALGLRQLRLCHQTTQTMKYRCLKHV